MSTVAKLSDAKLLDILNFKTALNKIYEERRQPGMAEEAFFALFQDLMCIQKICEDEEHFIDQLPDDLKRVICKLEPPVEGGFPLLERMLLAIAKWLVDKILKNTADINSHEVQMYYTRKYSCLRYYLPWRPNPPLDYRTLLWKYMKVVGTEEGCLFFSRRRLDFSENEYISCVKGMRRTTLIFCAPS